MEALKVETCACKTSSCSQSVSERVQALVRASPDDMRASNEFTNARREQVACADTLATASLHSQIDQVWPPAEKRVPAKGDIEFCGEVWPAETTKAHCYGNPEANMADLAKFANLQNLALSSLPMVDLDSLSKLDNLEYLILDNIPVTDLAPLANLTELKVLSIVGTKVTSLGALQNLKKLEQLGLLSTPVTKVEPLTKLTNLKLLTLVDNKVSAGQVEMLEVALPNLEIKYSFANEGD